MAVPWLEGGYFESLKDSEHISSKCIGIASDIQDGRAGVAQLVEQLGTLLIAKEAEARRQGTLILASVLQALPPEFLSEAELQFVVAFLCDRLKDHHSVLPATLQGILAVVSMTRLPAGAATTLASAIFHNVPGSSQSQEDRFTLYRILQVLVDTRATELRLAGPDFVYGVITTVDGERDPRNLLLIFSMLPRFIATFPLGHLAEEMFEVISCYFPVDFRSKTDDPGGISRDELAGALQACLTACPQFSEWCLPLLMEKLESTLRQAKMDSLRLLTAACEVFPVSSLQTNWSKLWHLLLPELLPGTDVELRDEALRGLQALVRAAASSGDHAFLRLLLATLLSATETCLCDVELSLFVPATSLLLAVCQASQHACLEVSLKVVPQLVEQLQSRSQAREREVLLRALTSFLIECVGRGAPAPEGVPVDVVAALCMDAARDGSPELRGEGLRGLAALAGAAPAAVRPQVYQLLCSRLRLETCSTTRRALVACLRSYVSTHADELLEPVLSLERSLDEAAEDLGDQHEAARCVESLGEVAVQEPLLSAVVPALLRRVLEPLRPGLCPAVARSLRKAAECEDGGQAVRRFLHERCNAVSRVSAWWLATARSGVLPPASHPLGDPGVVADLAAIILAVVSDLDSSSQASLVAKHLPVFLNASPPPLLERCSPPHGVHSVVLLEALLSGLRRDVGVPCQEELLARLVEIALHSEDSLARTCASRLLASFANKADGGSVLQLLASTQTAPELCAWVCKALVMRGHQEADGWTDRLMSALSRPVEGPAAARGFLLVLEDDPHFSQSCHCNIRLLYRQRFFQTVLERVPSLSSVEEHARPNYVLMLAHLLQGVPAPVLTSCLSQMLPLLMECLVQAQPSLLLSCSRTLHQLLRHGHPALHQYLDTLASRFLLLASFPSDMNVRVAALEGLLHLCVYPTHLLLPLKKQVVQGLVRCVDDRKRLVRRAAVKARNRWFLVGTASEPPRS